MLVKQKRNNYIEVKKNKCGFIEIKILFIDLLYLN